MFGAIAGDIIGSPYEFKKPPRRNFKLFPKSARFTDDTVLTVAQMDSLMNGKDWTSTIHEYFEKYEHCGYGGYFIKWCKEKNKKPYNSYGNGSAMRVSPVAWAYDNLRDVQKAAEKSASATHNHPEGIRGAEALASAIFLARTTKSKEIIKWYIENSYYFMNFSLNESKTATENLPNKGMGCSCQFSVPIAIQCFLKSRGFEEAIRNAVCIGGDTDTNACMAGSIAEAYYGIPETIKRKISGYVNLDLMKKVTGFYLKYVPRNMW